MDSVLILVSYVHSNSSEIGAPRRFDVLMKFLLSITIIATSFAGISVASESERSKQVIDLPVSSDQTNVLHRLFQSRFPADLIPKEQLSSFDVCPSLVSDQPPTQLYTSSSNDSKTQYFNSRIHLSADFVPENSDVRTVFEGRVTMTTAQSILKADRMVSDNVTETISAEGNVSVENEDSLLLASSFNGNKETYESTLSDVQFHFFSNNANGTADLISYDVDNVATLNELTFSTCPAGNNSWRFSADELQLNRDTGRGEAWGMWMKVEGIPIFYFPYLNFPIDDRRTSGMLMPSANTGGRNGLDITVPIYWNIAEDFDATFSPRTIQNRGEQVGFEFRYLNQYSMNKLSFEYLPNDNLAEEFLQIQPELANGLYGLSDQRWSLALRNTTEFNQNWTASIKTNRVSDRDYLRDLGSGIISTSEANSQTTLLSHGDISYKDDIWEVSLLAESTQSLAGIEPYRRLPSLVSNANYFQESSGLLWQFESDFSRFGHSDSTFVKGSRFNLMPSISFPVRNYYSWLTPKISYQVTSYNQTNVATGRESKIDRKLPIVSVDTGLYFDRSTTWGGKPFTQSVEPRIFYAYIPFREQEAINNFDSRLPDASFAQLNRANRFVGTDRIGDTNHLALSLTSRHIDNTTGEQILSFSMGRKLFFEDSAVTLNNEPNIRGNQFSPWLAEVKYRPSDKLELSGFIEWSSNGIRRITNSKTKLARSQIKYEPIPDHIVNLSHRIRNNADNPFLESNEEIDLSFAWPINDQWRLVGRWYNDLELGRTSETLFGFEYESCCWAISIVSRRYIDVRLDEFGNPLSNNLLNDRSSVLDKEFNSGVQFQFVFKGLGSPGRQSVSRLLQRSIRGYRARF